MKSMLKIRVRKIILNMQMIILKKRKVVALRTFSLWTKTTQMIFLKKCLEYKIYQWRFEMKKK